MAKKTAAVAVIGNDPKQAREVLIKESRIPVLPATIDTVEEAEALTSLVQDVEATITSVETRLKGPKQDAHKAWKNWTTLEAEICGPFRLFADKARGLLTAFVKRERLKREEEERQRAEAQRKADEERVLADAAELEAMAQETGDQAYADMAMAVIESAPAAAAVAPVTATKVEGMKSVSTRKVCRVVNVRLLCAEIGMSKVPPGVIKDLDMKALTAYIKESGRVPAGVTWEDDDSIAIGKKK